MSDLSPDHTHGPLAERLVFRLRRLLARRKLSVRGLSLAMGRAAADMSPRLERPYRHPRPLYLRDLDDAMAALDLGWSDLMSPILEPDEMHLLTIVGRGGSVAVHEAIEVAGDAALDVLEAEGLVSRELGGIPPHPRIWITPAGSAHLIAFVKPHELSTTTPDQAGTTKEATDAR